MIIKNLTRKIALSFVAFTLCTLGFAQERPPVTLKVGDVAPPIQIKKWIKGSPVTALGKGSVNVVEFWATWCGPCKESIPHLTELAHKYQGKATFTGVSVFEDPQAKDESYMSRVTEFVKDMGAKMDYNVGADGVAGVMGKTWMEAAGQDGIPTAFVVDQKGMVAWIGHPMDGLDEAVGQIINGKFDVKAEADRKAKAQAAAAKLQEDIQPLEEAVAAKKFDVAAAEAGKLIAKYPEHAESLAVAKFQFLLEADDKAAYAYARELASGMLKDKAEILNDMAWAMVDDTSPIKHRDYATAIIVAARAVKVNKDIDPFTLDTYAYALFKSGDAKGALDVQTKAIRLAEKMGEKVPAKTLTQMKARLAKIQEKAK
jgi:thiol-disulfide isomerase/thioredoxin